MLGGFGGRAMNGRANCNNINFYFTALLSK